MPIGPQTHRLTVNRQAGTAAAVEQLARDARLTTSTWIARLVAAAVRSLKPPQQEVRTP